MSSKSVSGIEYTKVAEIKGPLLILDGVTRSAFDELVEITPQEGATRLGKVLEVEGWLKVEG